MITYGLFYRETVANIEKRNTIVLFVSRFFLPSFNMCFWAMDLLGLNINRSQILSVFVL